MSNINNIKVLYKFITYLNNCCWVCGKIKLFNNPFIINIFEFIK